MLSAILRIELFSLEYLSDEVSRLRWMYLHM